MLNLAESIAIIKTITIEEVKEYGLETSNSGLGIGICGIKCAIDNPSKNLIAKLAPNKLIELAEKLNSFRLEKSNSLIA